MFNVKDTLALHHLLMIAQPAEVVEFWVLDFQIPLTHLHEFLPAQLPIPTLHPCAEHTTDS